MAVIVAVALALVAALSLLPGLLDSTRWGGPSLTISSPPSQESDTTRSSATGTYYAFWNDGESIVSYTYVLDEGGTGSLLLAGYDATDPIAQDDVDENEDPEGLRWDVDDDLVILSSAPGEPTLPDGDVSYELDGHRGSRVLSPTSCSPFLHETLYEDFSETLENNERIVLPVIDAGQAGPGISVGARFFGPLGPVSVKTRLVHRFFRIPQVASKTARPLPARSLEERPLILGGAKKIY